MWQLLYDSLNSIEVIDLLHTPQVKAMSIVEQIDAHNHDLKKTLTNLVTPQPVNEESEIQLVYAIIEEEKLIGVLYGDHVLNIKMQPFYTELIQGAVAIKSTDDVFNSTIQRVFSRIIKQKNSIIFPKEFEILRRFSNAAGDTQFMENTYCIDSTDFEALRLQHLCATRYFKYIKNEYSQKWNSMIAMKDFMVTKLYYKKHLLVGFTLYRIEDGEQFFWSGQYQEVLESLILKK